MEAYHSRYNPVETQDCPDSSGELFFDADDGRPWDEAQQEEVLRIGEKLDWPIREMLDREVRKQVVVAKKWPEDWLKDRLQHARYLAGKIQYAEQMFALSEAKVNRGEKNFTQINLLIIELIELSLQWLLLQEYFLVTRRTLGHWEMKTHLPISTTEHNEAEEPAQRFCDRKIIEIQGEIEALREKERTYEGMAQAAKHSFCIPQPVRISAPPEL
jgi:hypothetical protein